MSLCCVGENVDLIWFQREKPVGVSVSQQIRKYEDYWKVKLGPPTLWFAESESKRPDTWFCRCVVTEVDTHIKILAIVVDDDGLDSPRDDAPVDQKVSEKCRGATAWATICVDDLKWVDDIEIRQKLGDDLMRFFADKYRATEARS